MKPQFSDGYKKILLSFSLTIYLNHRDRNDGFQLHYVEAESEGPQFFCLTFIILDVKIWEYDQLVWGWIIPRGTVPTYTGWQSYDTDKLKPEHEFNQR